MTSIFNPYFFIITIGTLFRIVSMQTNNIIILKDKLIKVNLIIKLKEKLNLIILLIFNRCILSLNKNSIALH